FRIGAIQIWRGAEARLLPKITARTLSMLECARRGQLIDRADHAAVGGAYREILLTPRILIPIFIPRVRNPSFWIGAIGFDRLPEHITHYGIDIARAPAC